MRTMISGCGMSNVNTGAGCRTMISGCGCRTITFGPCLLHGNLRGRLIDRDGRRGLLDGDVRALALLLAFLGFRRCIGVLAIRALGRRLLALCRRLLTLLGYLVKQRCA